MSDEGNGKPTYDAPKVMPLGELAKGEGPRCRNGGSASDCGTGGTASNNCNFGQTAGIRCGTGRSPARCNIGLSRG